MSNLAKLEEKYGCLDLPAQEEPKLPAEPSTIYPTLEPAEQEALPLTHWRDSQPAVALSAFIKEHADQGFHLEQTANNEPVLNFDPGLKHNEPERFSLAMHAEELLCNALPDLRSLLDLGLIGLNQDRYQMWR